MDVILWEFQARSGQEAEFEQAYGPDGVWAKFFRQGVGFLGTELWRDQERVGRYFTVDRWVTRDAYETFRAARLDEYQAIDRRCEMLTEHETHFGTFASVQTGSAFPAPFDSGVKK
ncbi:MAG: antibiotic biosynthesis monooxygenase [Acidobacteriia bacterium]|nr:antibiotic biosynthesis monooxygenase [Terriglobia bacterium]